MTHDPPDSRPPRAAPSAIVPWAVVGLGVLACSVAAGERPPSIVLFVADDLGYAEPSCYGGDIPTPAIDRVASEGVRFTSGYVTASYCSPSRAGMLAGRLQTRFGHENNPVGAANCDPAIGLPIAERTIADRLRAMGYATALIGKWHLGGTAKFHPMRRGFDEFYGFLHEGHSFAPHGDPNVVSFLRRAVLPGGGQGRWTSADGLLTYSTALGKNEPPYDTNNPVLRGSLPIEEPRYFTDAITEESVDFVRRHKDRPFFLLVSYSAVHSPMQARGDDLRRFAHVEDLHRRVFAAMLHRLDQSVGAIAEELRALGILENTLLGFVSDNGGPTRELTSSNLPYRGGKGSLYEGGIRVPFVMRLPGGASAGVVSDLPVMSVDFTATALATAGAPAAGDGVDLRPVLAGRDAAVRDRELYWRMGRKGALRVGDAKLVVHNPQRDARFELYDLRDDPSESRDLASDRITLRDRMIERWARISESMADPLW